MTRLRLIGVLSMLFLSLQAAPGYAQATRTWVHGFGHDANPCSRTAPCRTFAGAIIKTAAGGEISVLDAGDFGSVLITKAISIINDAGVAALSANGAGIAIQAGANDVVVLRGLIIDGNVGGGSSGIVFHSGRSLHIARSVIKNFIAAAPQGFGINFAPTTAGAELFVTDTLVINNGDPNATAGAGINIQPSGAGSAKVALTRVQIENNRNGLRLNSQTGGSINVAMFRSTSVGNATNGIAAVSASSGGVQTLVSVDGSVVAQNNNAFNANGSTALILVGGSVVTGNNTVMTRTNNGAVQSYKTSMIDANGADVVIPAAPLD